MADGDIDATSKVAIPILEWFGQMEQRLTSQLADIRSQLSSFATREDFGRLEAKVDAHAIDIDDLKQSDRGAATDRSHRERTWARTGVICGLIVAAVGSCASLILALGHH